MNSIQEKQYRRQTLLNKAYLKLCALFTDYDHISKEELEVEVKTLINSLHEEADLHLYQELGRPTLGEVIHVDFSNGRKA